MDLNIKTVVTNAFILEGKRLIPKLEKYEIDHLVRRFMKYRLSMKDDDAFMTAFKDIPNLEQRSRAWAESRQ